MNKNMLGALLAGAAIGATLGVIFFSKNGSALRKEFANKTKRFAEELSQKIEEGKTILTDLQKKTSTVKNTVNDVMQS
jgi:gas vesicle protein